MTALQVLQVLPGFHVPLRVQGASNANGDGDACMRRRVEIDMQVDLSLARREHDGLLTQLL